MAIYKLKKERLKRKVDDIRLVRNPPKLLKSLAANILRLGTLIKKNIRNRKNKSLLLKS